MKSTKRASSHKQGHVKVAKADREWISQQAADEVLRRASDDSAPVKGEDLRKELDEMERLGL